MNKNRNKNKHHPNSQLKNNHRGRDNFKKPKVSCYVWGQNGIPSYLLSMSLPSFLFPLPYNSYCCLWTFLDVTNLPQQLVISPTHFQSNRSRKVLCPVFVFLDEIIKEAYFPSCEFIILLNICFWFVFTGFFWLVDWKTSGTHFFSCYYSCFILVDF